MNIDKVITKNKIEQCSIILIYLFLFSCAFITHDSILALISAFCGITYTILAGKGIPACYLIGITGSCIYAYLSYENALWGNLILYAGYYVPMQAIGFFQWNKNLKPQQNNIIKTSLNRKEKIFIITSGMFLTILTGIVLFNLGDKNPIIDSITTIFSVFGMLLTVKRCVEQWAIWIIVNGLSFIMWLKIALDGIRVYSTVFMWGIYFILAIYFYISWKKELTE